jgi:hypothetical protein
MKKFRLVFIVALVAASSIWLAAPTAGQTKTPAKTATGKGQSVDQLDPAKVDKILKENNIDPDKIDKSKADISKETRDRLERLLAGVYENVTLPRVLIQSQVGDTATGAVFEANGSAAVVPDPCAKSLNATPAIFQQPYKKRKLKEQKCPPDGHTVTVWEIVQNK